MDLIVDETCIALAMDKQIIMVSLRASHPGKYQKMDDVGVCGNPELYHVCSRAMVVSDSMLMNVE